MNFKHSVYCSLTIFMLIFMPSYTMAQIQAPDSFPRPQTEWSPETYTCIRADGPIYIDGVMDEPSWSEAPWTHYFVDIEGVLGPLPEFDTRVKMLWDDDYMYFAAEMEEPHVWGTLTERDSVIYHDNDFEIFIDPDSDNHLYYELEINALGTEWDLLLIKPYRDGGSAVNAWDIQGLRTAVNIDGTINNPSDTDTGWSVEIAIPWSVLGQAAGTQCPPENGDRWHMNFSRVEWDMEISSGHYIKETDTAGNILPEHNWVWSPQGLINMHYPEMWGIVEFSDSTVYENSVVEITDIEIARFILMQIYYRQRNIFDTHQFYTSNWQDIGIEIEFDWDWSWPPFVYGTNDHFEAVIIRFDGTRMSVTEDGRINEYTAD